jgi:glutamate-ammonia-ligase adenylyltransferase
MTQRLIAAVSAPTAEGVLYELDLRLRPSGNKGPVATHIEAFRKYQRHQAWTWEHMALTRARVVAGDAGLKAEIDAEIAAILATPRDFAKVAADAAEMRRLIEEEKPPRDLWDVKLVPGGLIDLEFIAQVAVLTDRAKSEGRGPGTREILARLLPDFADVQIVHDLTAAWDLYLSLTQMIRLCLTGPFDKDDSPPGLIDLLLAATGMPDIKVLEAHLEDTQNRVRGHFRDLLGSP